MALKADLESVQKGAAYTVLSLENKKHHIANEVKRDIKLDAFRRSNEAKEATEASSLDSNAEHGHDEEHTDEQEHTHDHEDTHM